MRKGNAERNIREPKMAPMTAMRITSASQNGQHQAQNLDAICVEVSPWRLKSRRQDVVSQPGGEQPGYSPPSHSVPIDQASLSTG